MSKRARQSGGEAVKFDDRSEEDSDTSEEEGSEDEEDEEDEEEDEEDGEEIDLTLDENGRIPGGTKERPQPPNLHFGFRSFMGTAMDPACLPGLIEDSRVAFTARTQTGGASYSAGETYFLPAASEPRTALESLAASVFRLHTQGLVPGEDYEPEISGAEWWTLVMSGDDDVGFHWDRDYELEGGSGVLVHPHLATVTYLTAQGGPTIITDRVSPISSEEPLEGDISTMLVSRPYPGKHISFDGRLLHGAPSEANVWQKGADRRGAGGNRERVTFLVNVWLNHTPLSAAPLPKAALSRMKAGDSSAVSAATMLPSWHSSEELMTPHLVPSDTPIVEWKFQAVAKQALRVPYPKEAMRGKQEEGLSALLTFPKDRTAAVVRGAKKTKAAKAGPSGGGGDKKSQAKRAKRG